MKKETFIAKTYQGIEILLLRELENLGANHCEILSRGVRFEGDLELLYRVNYFSRFSVRVLWQIASFSFQNNNQYYDAIYNIPVEQFLSQDGTMAVSSTVHDTIFKTPLFAAVLAKDAICDRFRTKTNVRPSVDKDAPDVQFHVHIHKNEATFYLDSSGESLHKRGYKKANHVAPLNEITAAAILQYSGWKEDTDLIDFMCGSGTILIEAAMQALQIPAGFYRSHYGFFSWKNFDQKLWNKVVNSADIKDDISIDFYGSDISQRFLDMAKTNVQEAELNDFIHLTKSDFSMITPLKTPAMVVINPPYDERLTVEDISALYKQIGDTLKHHYKDCTAMIITSNKEAMKSIGLHASQKTTLFNGPLECKLLKFELY